MYLDFNNIVTFSETDVTVPSGVTATKNNEYYYQITGYDYSVHVGQPLTVTISNVALNLNADAVKNASGATDLDLLSTSFSYVNNKQGTDKHFAQATVPMIGVGYTGPTPQWNGKVVSWAAVDGATSYVIGYSSKGDGNYTTEEVTSTSKDLTSFVNQYGANDYSFSVIAKRGALQNQMQGYSSKTWCEVTINPLTKKVGSAYPMPGTEGGTVTGELVSGDAGDAFGAPSQQGVISGLFAEGDVIKLTPTATEGYDFEKWMRFLELDTSDGKWKFTERTDNPFQFEVKKSLTSMQAQFTQRDVPTQDLAVTLQFGSAHATLAASDALKQALLAEGFSNVATQGSTVSMTTPSKNGQIIVTVGDTWGKISRAIAAATNNTGEDAEEKHYATASKPIDAYKTAEDLWTEQQTEGRKTLADKQEFHVLWAKPVSEVKVSVEAPTCGVEVTADPMEGLPGEYNQQTQAPRPSVTITSNNVQIGSDSDMGGAAKFWFTASESDPYGTLFVGTFEGESLYRANMILRPAFGYYFANDLRVVADDGSSAKVLMAPPGGAIAMVAVDIRAEHDWGDWSVTKPATVDEEGVETRVCKGNAEHTQTRPIKKLVPIHGKDCTMEPLANKTYTAKPIVPSKVVIKDNKGNVLVEGVDYDLEPLKNNINVGTVTVKATLKGINTGSVTGSFKILPAKITSAKGTAKTYNGKKQKTMWTVKAGKLSVPTSGFGASNYKANKNAGTAKATIRGKGNFTGSVTGTFAIKPATVTTVTTKAKVAYTGKAVKPKLVVKAGGVKVPSSGYTTTWSNNTKAGTATVKVAGKGNYKGSAKTTFRIVVPTVVYKGHMQTTGWEKSWQQNGQMSGSTAKAQRLEGIRIKLAGGFPVSGGIRYKAKVQGKGWEAWKKNGQLSGTTGQGKYMEAICIELTGKMKDTYNVYYRVHVQNFGWLGWAKDGVKVGTAGYNDRIEAIQIVLVPKGGKAPTPTYKGEHQWLSKSLVKK